MTTKKRGGSITERSLPLSANYLLGKESKLGVGELIREALRPKRCVE